MTYINILTYQVGRVLKETDSHLMIRWESGTVTDIDKQGAFFKCLKRVY